MISTGEKMSNPNNMGSGDGSRPTTDGGVDNIGAAGSFTPGATDASGPVPEEKMTEARKDAASARHDDSAPMGLTQPVHSTPNTEPPSSVPDGD